MASPIYGNFYGSNEPQDIYGKKTSDKGSYVLRDRQKAVYTTGAGRDGTKRNTKYVNTYEWQPQKAAQQATQEETNNNNNQPSYTPTPIDVGQVYTPIPTRTPTRTPTPTKQNTQEPFDTTPYDNIISQLSNQISSITQAMQTNTTNFNNQMAEYGTRFDEQQATYDKNLTSMRNTLLASNQPQREPVLGIKGAADKGNAQIKQLGRQGMKGTFSREGLRIKNINV